MNLELTEEEIREMISSVRVSKDKAVERLHHAQNVHGNSTKPVPQKMSIETYQQQVNFYQNLHQKLSHYNRFKSLYHNATRRFYCNHSMDDWTTILDFLKVKTNYVELERNVSLELKDSGDIHLRAQEILEKEDWLLEFEGHKIKPISKYISYHKQQIKKFSPIIYYRYPVTKIFFDFIRKFSPTELLGKNIGDMIFYNNDIVLGWTSYGTFNLLLSQEEVVEFSKKNIIFKELINQNRPTIPITKSSDKIGSKIVGELLFDFGNNFNLFKLFIEENRYFLINDPNPFMVAASYWALLYIRYIYPEITLVNNNDRTFKLSLDNGETKRVKIFVKSTLSDSPDLEIINENDSFDEIWLFSFSRNSTLRGFWKFQKAELINKRIQVPGIYCKKDKKSDECDRIIDESDLFLKTENLKQTLWDIFDSLNAYKFT